jgi:hypothetical protein
MWTSQEETKVRIGALVSLMDIHQARPEATQEEMKTSQEEMKLKMGVHIFWMDFVQFKTVICQDKTVASIGSTQEKTEAVVNFIWAKLEEAIKHRLEVVLTSVDQQTQGLCKKLNARIGETQLELRTFLDTGTKYLWEEVAGMRKDLHEELDLMVQVEMQATKSLVEAT